MALETSLREMLAQLDQVLEFLFAVAHSGFSHDMAIATRCAVAMLDEIYKKLDACAKTVLPVATKSLTVKDKSTLLYAVIEWALEVVVAVPRLAGATPSGAIRALIKALKERLDEARLLAIL